MRIGSLTNEIGLGSKSLMTMYCDNQVAIYIISNLMFHEQTKHIKIKHYFMKGDVCTLYVKADKQLRDID